VKVLPVAAWNTLLKWNLAHASAGAGVLERDGRVPAFRYEGERGVDGFALRVRLKLSQFLGREGAGGREQASRGLRNDPAPP
jgi:hypothetical protein